MKKHFEPGQVVAAMAYGGETVIGRVVRDLGQRVVICCEAEYQAAVRDKREPDGVGFPRADVEQVSGQSRKLQDRATTTR